MPCAPPEGGGPDGGGTADDGATTDGDGRGRVVLVGTPIGNLGDLSDRARRILSEADVVYCEDTRRTRALLSAQGIPAGDRLAAMHAHNELRAADAAVTRACGGALVAVVTDAGMPGISDPGAAVAAAAITAGVALDVVPGPAAAVAALVVSGLDGARWCFEGFLPRKGAPRAERIATIATDVRTTVIYESPHRVARTLADLAGACGVERQVACARELTKLHQELWRGSLGEALAWVDEHPPRGEWVLVVAGAPARAGARDGAGAGAGAGAGESVLDALAAAADAGVDRRQAVRDVARTFALPRRQVYQDSLTLSWARPAATPTLAATPVEAAPDQAPRVPPPPDGYITPIAASTVQIAHTLRLPSDVMSVPLVRNLVRASLDQLDVDPACVADVALAVTEACANVVTHARGDGKEYRVEVEITPDACVIRVVDAGSGFDAGRVPGASPFAEHGRGVALMRALVDDLHFIRRDDPPGTIVQLVKKLTISPGSPLHPHPTA